MTRGARCPPKSTAGSSFPVESALVSGKGPGWRTAQRGKQTLRIMFDKPTRLRRIRLEFSETEIARTQEFTLQWAAEPGGPFRELVRQQWSFSPQGSTSETEDYQVSLDNVSVLELEVKPDSRRPTHAQPWPAGV
jgi:hypothetical protein